jgi:hypothetical protein
MRRYQPIRFNPARKKREKLLKSRHNAAQHPFSVRMARGYAASAVAGYV